MFSIQKRALARTIRFALTLAVFCCGHLFAGNEKIVASRAGIAPLSPITGTASMTIQDQWYSYMVANPLSGMTPWTNTFNVPEHSNGLYDAWTNVVLRHDDSRLHFYQYDWDFTVEYDITTYSFNPVTGASINSGVLNGSLTINHTATGTYTDKALMRYPDAFKAVLTITSCTLTVHTSPSVTVTYGSLPSEYNDIYLDLEQETQRNYLISTAPVCGTPMVTPFNELSIDWGFVRGAESYDVEWLFIDEPVQTLATASLAYDFRNATRVNTPNQFYNIPMVYPRGILLYRVRGVSRDPDDPTLWITGDWSFAYETGVTDDVNTEPGTFSFRFRKDLNGHLPEMNWQYSASFAEDGKRVEAITYFDGSLRSRQQQSIRNTDSNLIVGEVRYDYDGRAVVQILPVPLSDHDGLTYYPDLNPNFDRSDFALDANIDFPGAMSNTSGAGQYYSSANPEMSGLVAYVPDAEGYPYTQVRYATDGTGRVRSQSMPGGTHHLGSDHETKYFYGSPTSQDEIDRLFGNEVGDVSHYQKNMVLDANGQVSVSYLDQEGRVIATSLAGAVPDNLIELDGRPLDETHTDQDLLLGRNRANGDNTAMVSSTTLVCTAENTDYNFTYELTSDTTCHGCFICKDCMYDLTITIVDQDGFLVDDVTVTSQTCSPSVSDNPITCEGISSGSYAFTATLDIGTYTVTKTLKLSEASLQQYEQEYQQYQLEGQGCVQMQPIHPEPCDFDCESMCYQQYTIILEDGSVQHVDENGEPVDMEDEDAAEAWGDLVSGCITTCQAPATTNPDPCALHFALLVADMSPDGQYFDNLPFKEMFSVGGSIIPAPGYDENDWTVTNIWADGAAAWASADFRDPSNNVIDSWDELRLYWQPGWATQTFGTAVSGHSSLVQYHPEYCLYNQHCGDVACSSGRLDMGNSNSFDSDMYTLTDNTAAASAGYFNTVNFSGSELGTNPTGDNINYINDDYIYNITTGVDPYLNCNPAISGCGGPTTAEARMEDYLRHFLPVTISSVTYYYSIWYVIDDPDDIHTNGISLGVPSDVVDYFQALHGGGAGTALIGTGPGQITKYEYYRSVYMYYKSLIQYAIAAEECGNPLADTDHNTFTDESLGAVPMPGFQIRYPQNALYDAWINASPSMLCGHDQSGLEDALEDMNDLFDDISEESDSTGICSCHNFQQYLEDNNLTSEADGDVAIFINADPSTGITTADAADVSNWISMCGGTNPDNAAFGTDFPPSWRCIQLDELPDEYDQATCTCENIRNVINMLSFDPADPDSYDEITAGLNGYLAPATPITMLDWLGWLAECETSDPSMGDLTGYNLPEILECPEAASEGPDDVHDAQETAACMQNNLVTALANSIMIFHQQLENEMDPQSSRAYLAYTRQNCLNNLAGREIFTVTYTSNEFLYTLYYYDQAGNLIKTVPPLGVDILDASEVDDVQDYRAVVPGSAYKVPDHTFVTNYKYNSLQQVTYTVTPDGGATNVFYDKLGRVVASQTDKQASVAYSATPCYSYIRYDNLGRIEESGELKQSTALTDDIARDKDPGTSFYTWLTVPLADRKQVVVTYYDTPMSGSVPGFGSSQENLRGRVSSVVHYNGDGSALTYSNAYHYSYDIHGNVKALSDEVTNLYWLGEDVKLTTYSYDVFSGNVNEVHYQEGYDDEFYYRYEYDADNRLTIAYTSSDGVIWEKESKYFYYPVGPMGRTEIGDKQVQATDYAFNIYGWIKAANSETRDNLRDIGKDGSWNSGAGQNGYFAHDAYGFTLKYFDGDYTPVSAGAADCQAAFATGNTFYDTYYSGHQLYNGNIAAMTTALTDENEQQVDVMARNFQYDQLNRIKQVDAFTDANILTDNDWSSAAHTWDYYESFAYDYNGNITGVIRNGINAVAQEMDQLEYVYPYMDLMTPVYTNRLDHVVEHTLTSDAAYGIDIDNNQAGGNYTYEEDGNLKGDVSEDIDRIDWTPQGKVWKVTRITGSDKDDLEFVYDAMGNRIEKIAKPRVSGNPTDQVAWTHTYYRRDASGNVLAVYSRTFTAGSGNFDDHYGPIEQHIYGSSRIGIRRDATAPTTVTFTSSGYNSEGYFQGTSYTGASPTPHDLSVVTAYDRELGTKEYELSNHLGNVLETVSDRKLSIAQNNVLTSNFASSTSGWSAYGATVSWDSPTQRLKIIASAAGDGATQSMTTVRGVHYTLSFKTDVNVSGIDAAVYDNSSNLLVSKTGIAADGTYTLEFTAVDNNTTVRFTSHVSFANTFYLDDISIGNAALVEHYTSDVLRYGDYYVFGQAMPGRNGGSNYRYSFNGQENQNGLTEGDLDFGMRIYDSRLGRWFSVDPYSSETPSWTPYRFGFDNPVFWIDRDGGREFPSYQAYQDYARKNGLEIMSADNMWKQGHWLYNDVRFDGEKMVFNTQYGLAALRNTFQNRSDEYVNPWDRALYYSWADQTLRAKGHEVKWPGAAYGTVQLLRGLLDPTAVLIGWSNPEIQKFVHVGNEMILRDMMPRIESLLLMKEPLTGNDALKWDAQALSNEQNLVQPLWNKLSAESVAILQSNLEFFDNFEGDITNVADRWAYGMKKMGYNVDPSMMPAPNGDYTKVKLQSGGKNSDGTINVIIQQ